MMGMLSGPFLFLLSSLVRDGVSIGQLGSVDYAVLVLSLL